MALATRKENYRTRRFGGIILFVYGIIPTLQPAEFGRVYAAYGGIFIVSTIIWGRIVDKKKPDRYEVALRRANVPIVQRENIAAASGILQRIASFSEAEALG